MKYVVDIDGTICRHPKGNRNEYRDAMPIYDRIAKINKLYDSGHTVIYLTARGMGRYNDDTYLANKEFYQFTYDQLRSWGCKFHKLFLGKPSGDYYIDDKGIHSDDFFKT